ncbi:hypothetical protein RvY_04871-2 [Ramazzottius varieornatus]|uniref:G-protein coupled receptors family 1 profile domain-containing protein n=1 Tax=Ramazzottius varieornatus TaxID=947166 RepID=A0A1D1V292_RAMVA|nr:hypothetical protein RvY_04871-2 [Ramazzottius varieornatus]
MGTVYRWLYLPPYLYNASLSLRRNPSFKRGFSRIHGPQVWLQETFIQQSDWTLILFSVARLCAIVQPFKWQWIHDAQITRRTLIILSFLSAVFTLNNVVKISYLDAKSIGMDHAPSWLAEWSEIQHQAEVVCTMIKVSFLITINVAVLIALRRQRAEEIGETLDVQPSTGTTNSRKYKNSNYILLGSVAMYLVTQAPSLIVNCLMIAADNYGSFRFPQSVRLFINPFASMSYFTSYSVNFLLYLAVSERFRAQFGQMLGRRWGLRADSSNPQGSVRPRPGHSGAGKPENGFFNMTQAFRTNTTNLQLQYSSSISEVQLQSPM